MERTLTNFVRALRSAGVPVSTAESIDAARTLSLVGYDDRENLKLSLEPVVAKSIEEQDTYDRLFDLYFAKQTPQPPAEDQAPEASEGGSVSSEMNQTAEAFMSLASSGNGQEADMAIRQAASQVGAQDIKFSTQVSFFANKILEQLGVRELEKELIDRLTAHTEEGDAEAEALMAAREEMRQRARAHVEQQFEVFGRSATENFMNEVVVNKPMRALDRRDMARMKQLIRKMAKRLAQKYGRRPKAKNRGILDIRKTLRRNAGLDGVPFNITWKQKRRDRPKIIAICDVSGSVSDYVRFLLLFLYTLNESIRDIHSYAFSHRLRDVTHLMDTLGYEAAFDLVMKDLGAGSTDYGQALSDLKTDHWQVIDRRTTILILGDGRNNNGDPRMDIFKEVAAQAKRVVWLCPEPPVAWGTGDSCMLQYRTHCNQVSWCQSAADLERVIDDLLSVYV